MRTFTQCAFFICKNFFILDITIRYLKSKVLISVLKCNQVGIWNLNKLHLQITIFWNYKNSCNLITEALLIAFYLDIRWRTVYLPWCTIRPQNTITWTCDMLPLMSNKMNWAGFRPLWTTPISWEPILPFLIKRNWWNLQIGSMKPLKRSGQSIP